MLKGSVSEINIMDMKQLRWLLNDMSLAAIGKPTVTGRPLALVAAQVAVDSHARNVLAGWWHDPKTKEPLDRNVPELMKLMVSELSEVPEYMKVYSEYDDKLPKRLMGEVELADFGIRVTDTAGARLNEAKDFGYCYEHAVKHLERFNQVAMPAGIAGPMWPDWALMNIVRSVSKAMEGHRKNKKVAYYTLGEVYVVDFYLAKALAESFYLANLHGFDMAGAWVDKLIFNASREDHKPENRIKEGGKAF